MGQVKLRGREYPSARARRLCSVRTFQRSLGNTHNVVVLNDHLAAIIGHGEERSAFAHQRLGEMRHAN